MSTSESGVSGVFNWKTVSWASCADGFALDRERMEKGLDGCSASSSEVSVGVWTGVRRRFGFRRGDVEKVRVCLVVGEALNGRARGF